MVSIINKMLSDMENKKQEKKNEENNDQTLSGLQAPPKTEKVEKTKKKKVPWQYIVLLIILFALVVVLTHLVMGYYSNKASPKKIKGTSVTFAPNVAKPQPVKITGMVVGADDAHTNVDITLDRPTHYRVSHDASQNEMDISLAHVNTKADLPSLRDNQALERVDQSFKNGQLTLKFYLKKNAKPLGVMQNASNSQRLSIVFSNPPQPTKTKSQPKAKAPAKPANEQTTNASDSNVEKTFSQPSQGEQAASDYDEALTNLNDGDYQSAVKALQRALTVSPNYLPAQEALVSILLQQKNYSMARRYLDQALSQRPQDVELLQLKAKMNMLQGRYQQALKTLQSYSPPVIDALDYYALMAAVEEHLGKHFMAAQIYHQILQYQPDNGKWWLGLGVALENADQPNAAIEAYQKAIDTGTLSPDLQANAAGRIHQLQS